MSRRGRASSPISLFSFQDIITSVTGIVILLALTLAIELVNRKRSSGEEGNSAQVAEHWQKGIDQAQEEIDRLKKQLDQTGREARQLVAASPQDLAREIHQTIDQVTQLEAEVRRLEQQEKETQKREEKTLADSFDRKVQKDQIASLEEQIRTANEKINELKRSNRMLFNPASGTSKDAWIVDVSADRLLAAPLGVAVAPQVFERSVLSSAVRNFFRFATQRDAGREYFVLLVRPSGIEALHDLQSELVDLGFDLGFDLIGPNQTVLDPETGAAFP